MYSALFMGDAGLRATIVQSRGGGYTGTRLGRSPLLPRTATRSTGRQIKHEIKSRLETARDEISFWIRSVPFMIEPKIGRRAGVESRGALPWWNFYNPARDL